MSDPAGRSSSRSARLLPDLEREGAPLALLECRVTKGVFPHERTIYVDGEDRGYESCADAGKVELQTDESDLENKPTVPGLVRVRVVTLDEDRHRALVELPEEVVMGGRRVWVAVAK